MREIKFRIWDKNKKRMFYPDDFGNKIKLPWEDVNKKYSIYMQYTGLKDINGKEIYEGDIVQLEPPDEEWIGVVFFDKGSFKIKYGELSVILYEEIYDFFGNIYAKIIGNIYENPELLEEK